MVSLMHDVKETATRLNVSTTTVYALIKSGKLGCHRVGVGRGVIRITDADIEAYLNNCRHETGERLEIPAPRRRRLKHIRL